MALIKQTWTLMSKNYRYILFRHVLTTIVVGFLVPIIISGFLSFAQRLFVPNAEFGIGDAAPIASLADALDYAAESGREKLLLLNNGHEGGAIDRLFDRLEDQVARSNPRVNVTRLENERSLVRECRSSLRGVTACYGAVVMRASPDEGNGGIWNYTIRTDSEFASSAVRINVHRHTNPEQVYLMPIQRAIDSIIVDLEDPGAEPFADTREYPFTRRTQEQWNDNVRRLYHGTITNFLAVGFSTTVIFITYHLTGFIAAERESGMSTLIDAMMPVRQQWMAQAARILAAHLSFSSVYFPAWVIASLVVSNAVWANTSVGIVLVFHVLSGLALASMSIMIAAFFKKAQLSGSISFLFVLIMAIIAQVITNPNLPTVAVLSFFFTPCAYVYFATLMSRFERQQRGASLTELPPESPWQMPGYVFFILLICQIFVYPLLGALIERHLYGTSTKGRQVIVQKPEGNGLADHAVQLEGFTKIYPRNLISRMFPRWSKQKQAVTAVDNLSFSATRGQIVALLGANGSGKSTTLDAIAGLNRVTSGSIKIDGTGGLGIAPQKNVLWDDLTVEEHLFIFNRLKSPNAHATKAEIKDLIRSIDLWPKRKAQAKTLSGGQKRKLQLGMMLTGGSAVCCVDEVSSGIDPLSRRKLWDILLAERGKRTLILTTHFLDEADLLADHIVILSKGTLKAEGSSVALKDNRGGGYRVHVHKSPDMPPTPAVEGVQKKDAFDLVTYTAPSSLLAAAVIKELESTGIHDYRFSGPTIEDVFLQLADEIRDEEAFRANDRSRDQSEKISDDGDGSGIKENSASGGLQLMDGQKVGYFKQAVILFRKRFVVFKRNWFPYFLAFILPIAVAGLASIYVTNEEPIGCTPESQSRGAEISDAFTQNRNRNLIVFFAGPSARLAEVNITRLVGPLFSAAGRSSEMGARLLENIHVVETYQQFQDYVLEKRANVSTGLWLGDSNEPPTLAWGGDLFVTNALTSQQYFNIFLSEIPIATTWSPFEIPFSPEIGDGLNLVVYMGIALTCFPGFMALYPSSERRKFVRGLQYSNGVRPLPLWAAYLLFDFIITLVSAAIVTALWSGLSSVWYHLEYVFVVLALYGLASTLWAYVISLFTKSQLGTFAWTAATHGVIFLGYLIAYMCIITYVEAAHIDDTIQLVHFIISAIAPIGSIARALFVTLNLFSSACDGDALSDNPGRLLGYGGPIMYLIIQSIILFIILILVDGGLIGPMFSRLFSRRRDSAASDGPTDEELTAEMKRVTSNGTHEDGLRVMNLTKSFGKNTAVDNVTFGIKRGEVFALLGPNGAGKSTTISLIRGDIKPSRNGGDVLVEDVSVIKNLTDARSNLGVCPQVDALDQMTVREHLEFYAKVRGIQDVQHNVTAILRAVGLESFSSRMAYALSGGNKRKLSLGIALMGNPTVVLLDEPSSGLDAAAKRIMWKTLQATVPGRSILLTTHSMEEADALAGRAGILARRLLALGTPDDLRHRFGDALHVHLVSLTAPRTSPEEMQRVIHWIRSQFPAAEVEEKTYHGQLRFSVPPGDVLAVSRGGAAAQDAITRQGQDVSQSAIGHLVVMLEEHKKELGIGHYSVSPTTLDQVFLTIVGQHNVREENSEEEKRQWWPFSRPKFLS
ncbi:hypothetical protein B0I35DRAFT_217622 [Stachybotrys elegans]|uniref:ABC transporter domain-containing protein n=1 Tax=Stachybotrys elegans TaxID=80388 RepID=A0A8K0SW73_9HYPO|nr:hypothetical protein B0I35DRAFT_217622 [Stachybotrys elegans]